MTLNLLATAMPDVGMTRIEYFDRFRSGSTIVDVAPGRACKELMGSLHLACMSGYAMPAFYLSGRPDEEDLEKFHQFLIVTRNRRQGCIGTTFQEDTVDSCCLIAWRFIDLKPIISSTEPCALLCCSH